GSGGGGKMTNVRGNVGRGSGVQEQANLMGTGEDGDAAADPAVGGTHSATTGDLGAPDNNQGNASARYDAHNATDGGVDNPGTPGGETRRGA
ncbi:MAG TPA: hypothetical protein VM490_20510, partial [Armatimonadaceae bacterium]|nr:hypothetical protein [Armatimonadaceae bacterium]